MTGPELYRRLVELIREGVDAIPGHLDPVREALVDPVLAFTAALLQFLA
jgi:hypothetical protein